ncbi:hypothetical protein KKB43_02110 [Patescibacteria group bacterium]|nr:hypothetical protein [Patescibacteria group bacterium]MBU4338094.1 hypothetical protein [Patescibacteria group bacterium]MBU4579788.1 hypothetical protein [Patescibacteria group bacterium]
MKKNLQLREPVTIYIEKIKKINRKSLEKQSMDRIKVSYAASTISFLYEKIRNTVDYKEEFLLRKYAIERILNRLIFIENKKNGIGEALLSDLIRGRYFLNDTISIDKIAETDQIIKKYLTFFDKPSFADIKKGDANKIIDWFIGIAAFEIEKNLVSYDKEEALCEFIYNIVCKDIIIKDGFLNERQEITQTYLAILRAALRADRSILSYYLMKAYWPDWFGENWILVSDELAKNILSTKSIIDKEINHPVAERFLRFFKRRAVVYFIISDLIVKNASETEEKMLSSKLNFLEDIQEACAFRYEKAREVLSRTFKRSVAYIFATKIALAFIIEVPYEMFTMAKINYTSLSINVIFHPSLMYVVGSSIKMPKEKNTAQIIREAEYVVYKKKKSETPPYINKFSFSQSSFSGGLFFIFYAAMFIITFGLIIAVLKKLEFNFVSGALFIFFISVVSFFAFKISRPVRELIVIDKNDSLVDIVLDFFFIPVMHFGRWLSESFSQINIFVFALDFIIEAPFKTLIKIFDDWVKYLKEKREEMM